MIMPAADADGSSLDPANDDDDGSDHANDFDDSYILSRRPQHHKNEDGNASVSRPPQPPATPHGAMTSILSAAGSKPPKSERKKHWQSLPRKIKLEESATKKALRMRASKYFHRSASSPGKDGATSTTLMNVRENTGKGVTALQQQPVLSSNNSDSTTAPSTVVTPENTPQREEQRAATAPRRRPPTPSAPSPKISAFFPRTAVPPNWKRDATASTADTVKHATTPSLADDPNSYEEDPDLQTYLSDLDASSGYGSGGSDLENAARRILRGKNKRFSSSRTIPRTIPLDTEMVESTDVGGSGDGSNGTDGAEGGHTIGNVAGHIQSLNGRKSSSKRAPLPKGWRERIERKTGMQVPRMQILKMEPQQCDFDGHANSTAAALEEEANYSEDAVHKNSQAIDGCQDDGVHKSARDVPHGEEEGGSGYYTELTQSKEVTLYSEGDCDFSSSPMPAPSLSAVPERLKSNQRGYYQQNAQFTMTDEGQQHHAMAGNEWRASYAPLPLPRQQQYSQLRHYPEDGQCATMDGGQQHEVTENEWRDCYALLSPYRLQSEYDNKYYPKDLANTRAFLNHSRDVGAMQKIHREKVKIAWPPPSSSTEILAESPLFHEQPPSMIHEYDEADGQKEEGARSCGVPPNTSTNDNHDGASAKMEAKEEGNGSGEKFSHGEQDLDFNMSVSPTKSGSSGGGGDPNQEISVRGSDQDGDLQNISNVNDKGISASTINYANNEYGHDDSANHIGSCEEGNDHNNDYHVENHESDSDNQNNVHCFVGMSSGDLIHGPPPEHVKRVHFSPSVDVGAGAADDDGSKDNKYFHCFHTKTRVEKVTTQNSDAAPLKNDANAAATCWEDLPTAQNDDDESAWCEMIPSSTKLQWNSSSSPGNIVEAAVTTCSSPRGIRQDSMNADAGLNLDTFASSMASVFVHGDDEKDSAWSGLLSPAADMAAPTTNETSEQENSPSPLFGDEECEDSEWSTSILKAAAMATTTNAGTMPTLTSIQEDAVNLFRSKKDLKSPMEEGVSCKPQWHPQKLILEKQKVLTDVGVNRPRNINGRIATTREVRETDLKMKQQRQQSPPIQPMCRFSKWDESQLHDLSMQPLCAFSDGDLSGMESETSDVEGRAPSRRAKSRRGPKFFRLRNRKYSSEGEWSDNDWDSDRNGKPSFSLSPLGSRKKSKTRGQSKGPKKLFQGGVKIFGAGGEKCHGHVKFCSFGEQGDYNSHSSQFRMNIWDEPDKTMMTKFQPIINVNNKEAAGGAGSNTVKTVYTAEPHKLLLTKFGCSHSINTNELACSNTVKMASTSSADPEPDHNDSTKPGEQVAEDTRTKTNPNDSKENMSPKICLVSNNEEDGQPLNDGANINLSRETHATSTTVMVSNSNENVKVKAYSKQHPPVLRSDAKSSTMPSNSSDPPTMPPLQTPSNLSRYRADAMIETKASEVLGAHLVTTIHTEKVDDETISTLGSLVTKGTGEARCTRKSMPPATSDMSTVTELNEIERLRKENDRLREQLENASHLSSKVSSMYTERLKVENNRLKEKLEYTSLQSTKAENVYKSTLETLLENRNEESLRKNGRRTAAAVMNQAETIADFNYLPPVAHLINGVDFDDDSITTYSPIGGDGNHTIQFERDAECELPGPFLKKTCSRIVTTTRTVAVQMKSVAQDLNNERQEKGIYDLPIPGCFTVCTRRNRKKDSTKTATTRKQMNSMRRKCYTDRTLLSDKSSATGSETFFHGETPKMGKSLPSSARSKGRNVLRERAGLAVLTNRYPMPARTNSRLDS